MGEVIGRDFVSRATEDGVCVADSAFVMPNRAFSRSAETPLQPSPDRVEISQRGGDFQAVQVLGEATVADLLEPKHPLDHPDRVLNLRATHPRGN